MLMQNERQDVTVPKLLELADVGGMEEGTVAEAVVNGEGANVTAAVVEPGSGVEDANNAAENGASNAAENGASNAVENAGSGVENVKDTVQGAVEISKSECNSVTDKVPCEATESKDDVVDLIQSIEVN